jgi:hypothetical protein
MQSDGLAVVTDYRAAAARAASVAPSLFVQSSYSPCMESCWLCASAAALTWSGQLVACLPRRGLRMLHPGADNDEPIYGPPCLLCPLLAIPVTRNPSSLLVPASQGPPLANPRKQLRQLISRTPPRRAGHGHAGARVKRGDLHRDVVALAEQRSVVAPATARSFTMSSNSSEPGRSRMIRTINQIRRCVPE